MTPKQTELLRVLATLAPLTVAVSKAACEKLEAENVRLMRIDERRRIERRAKTAKV